MTFQLKPALIGLATALLLAACASGPPKPTVDYKSDYDFSQVKKIAFYKKSGQVTGDNPLQLSDIQKNRADNALEFALRNKGFELIEDPKQADMLISWHLVTQHKTDVRTYSSPGYAPYMGYNRYAMYSCWSCMPMQTDVSVQNYTEGTFIVDMIDPNLRQSVWRGVTKSKLRGHSGNEDGNKQEAYNEAATVIFAEFPPM